MKGGARMGSRLPSSQHIIRPCSRLSVPVVNVQALHWVDAIMEVDDVESSISVHGQKESFGVEIEGLKT